MSGIYKHLGGKPKTLDVVLKVDETNAMVESITKAHPKMAIHNKTMAAGKRQLAESAEAASDDPIEQARAVAEAEQSYADMAAEREEFWQGLAIRIRKYMQKDDWNQDDDALKFMKLLAATMMDLGNGDLRTAHVNLSKATDWLKKFAVAGGAE